MCHWKRVANRVSRKDAKRKGRNAGVGAWARGTRARGKGERFVWDCRDRVGGFGSGIWAMTRKMRRGGRVRIESGTPVWFDGSLLSMKTHLFALISVLLLLCGCSSVESRIKEKSASFYSLDGPTQERLKKGVVHVGDMTDMVYVALGKPDRVRERTTGEGTRTTWVYNTYCEEYQGTQVVGYRRRAVIDRRDGVIYSYYRPVRADVYEQHQEEYLRVVFVNGRVTVIEQEDTD